MMSELQNLDQWLCWRFEERDGKPTKVPYCPVTGMRASSTNPWTWAGYEAAVKACKERGYDGVGFALTSRDGLCGVDLDGCRDPETGQIEPWAKRIVDELNSYSEISPSGTGVHVILKGELPPGQNRKGAFEVYDRGRYFTFTGEHLHGTPKIAESRQEALEALVDRILGSPATNDHAGVLGPIGDNELSDDEIVEKAHAAANGERFSRLWSGDANGYGSRSEADLALCGMLAFWTGPDPARIDGLFRRSGLNREKWDREDYRNRTISEALRDRTEFYEAPKTVALSDGAKETEERRNQADRLIGYALGDMQALFVDQHGAPHALVNGEVLPLNSRCYSWLRRLMWEQEVRAVGGEYLRTAAGTLAAHAEFSGEVRELHVRAAWVAEEGALYYELRPDRVVRVDAGGWSIANSEATPVLFRRYPNLKPLPDPERGGDLRGLWAYLNLKTERDKRLLLAYVATVTLPHVPRPILNVAGAMGSGKSTLSRLIKRTLDPTTPETIRCDPRDLLQKAGHAYILMLDNLSTLPEQAAVTVCRLVTGEADSKRRLYSDDEDVIVELKRAVLLNGINVPTERGDVLDRSLVLELERIPDDDRLTEEALWARFSTEHPKLLGAIFDVLALSIARKSSLRLPRRPRLADWGEYAAAVYEALGWGAEQFLSDWDEVVKVQNQGTLDGSPVAQAIIKLMEGHDTYDSTSSKVHATLKSVAEEQGVDVARDKAWPKSARWLWRRIKEVLPLLVAAGIEASREHTDKGTIIALRKVSRRDVSVVSQNENSVGKPNADDTQGSLMSEPDVRAGSNVSPDVRNNAARLPVLDDPDNTDDSHGGFSRPVSFDAEPGERVTVAELKARRSEAARDNWRQHSLDCECDACMFGRDTSNDGGPLDDLDL
jgi:putative DNA primase/helicase